MEECSAGIQRMVSIFDIVSVSIDIDISILDIYTRRNIYIDMLTISTKPIYKYEAIKRQSPS